jgi:hypothetical protein
MTVKPTNLDRALLVNQNLNLSVRTENLGSQNVGGAHVFDRQGNSVDVDLQWSGKSDRDQDLFTGSIPLTALWQRGLQPGSPLAATAYVKVGADTLWEGRDTAVVTPKRNTPVSIGAPNQRGTSTSVISAFSGELSVDRLNQQGPMRGSHTGSREVAVTGLSFKPKGEYFANATRIDVEIFPETKTFGIPGSADTSGDRAGIREQNKTVIVSLERQPDGSFKSPPLGQNQAWLTDFSENGYASRVVTGFNFSLVDQNGKRDEIGENQGYSIS